jgi:cysteine-rich repeat protein
MFGSFTDSGARRLQVLSLALLLAACGGKKELTFVGAPPDDVTGGDGGGGTVVSASCGNRVVDKGEGCDDGDRADGDGCDGACAVEEGWTCSGKPSTCVKCGNSKVETGEDCDDGNLDDGDGCNKECKVEGSCEGPIPIELKADKDGFVGTVTSMTSKGEAGQVPAADCGGAMVGAGSDRVFEVDLPIAADIDVRVGSNFDAIVRLTTTPCDLATAVLGGGCIDNGAVAEEEAAHIDNAPPGKYYIVVDGKTAQQAGSFSVNVEARCPLDSLKIARVITTVPFRTVVLNTNQKCAIDLSRVGVYGQPEAADGPKTLPAVSLDPLKRRVLTSQSPPPNGTTYQGNIPYDSDNYAGAFYLCRGQCDTAKGTNVFDAVRWSGDTGKPKTPPLSAVHFDALVPALADRTKMSFFRVTKQGAAPNFLADDFVGAYFAETFEDGTLSGWEPPVALFYTPKFDMPVDDTIGDFSLQLDGGNATAGVWNGPIALFRDNDGTPTTIQPTSVSLRVRSADKTLSLGWAFFGNDSKKTGVDNSEAAGFGSFFRPNGTFGIGSADVVNFGPAYVVETWYLLEYRVITYPTSGVGGAVGGVFLNGKSIGSNMPLHLRAADGGISQISLRNIGLKSSSWFDQIIVR